jgi:rubredoxin
VRACFAAQMAELPDFHCPRCGKPFPRDEDGEAENAAGAEWVILPEAVICPGCSTKPDREREEW